MTWLTSFGVVSTGSVPLTLSTWAETVDGGSGAGNGSSSSSLASSFSSRCSSASKKGSLPSPSLSVRAGELSSVSSTSDILGELSSIVVVKFAPPEATAAAVAVASAFSPVSSETSVFSDPILPVSSANSTSSDTISPISLPDSTDPSGPSTDVSLSAVKSQ